MFDDEVALPALRRLAQLNTQNPDVFTELVLRPCWVRAATTGCTDNFNRIIEAAIEQPVLRRISDDVVSSMAVRGDLDDVLSRTEVFDGISSVRADPGIADEILVGGSSTLVRRLDQLVVRSDDLSLSAGASQPFFDSASEAGISRRTMDVFGNPRSTRFTRNTTPPIESAGLVDGVFTVRFDDGIVVRYSDDGFPVFSEVVLPSGRSAVVGDLVLDQADILGSADFAAANLKLAKQVDDGAIALPDEVLTELNSLITRNDAGEVVSARNQSLDSWTWHHHQETGRMQLVAKEVHSPISHLGGARVWGERA